MRTAYKHILFWICYAITYLIIDSLSFKSVSYLDEIIVILINIFTIYSSYLFIQKISFAGYKKPFKSVLYFILNISLFYLTIYIYRYILAPQFSLPQIVKRNNVKDFIVDGAAWLIQLYFWALGYFFAVKSVIKEKQLRLTSEEKLMLQEKNQQLLLENQALERRRLQTESAFLRSQINPHFLQNTLNFLYSKTRQHSTEISEGVLLLSDIMRYSLQATQNQDDTSQLKEEMEHLQNLMKLQQLRFGNQLNIKLETKGNWEQLTIPPLTLITLAENAFKYGEMHEEQNPVTIKLCVPPGEEELQFTVHNKKKTGPVEISYGIGHDNIRNRLAMKYGDNFTLTAKNEEHFYTVHLTINL